MRKLALLVAVVALACVVSGCVTYSAGVAPSTKPLGPDEYTVQSGTSGTSWGINVLGIPFKQASTADAVSDALHGADALIQVTVDNRTYNLPFVYLQRVTVEGIIVKEPVRVKKD